MSLENILDFDHKSLRELFTRAQLEPYRADQVLEWVYKKNTFDFEKMTNLPVELRQKLKQKFVIQANQIAQENKSKSDGSVKLLIQMSDKELAETVYIPHGQRRTVCVSSQVGCKFGCVFCASGQAGFMRNLTATEIVSQVLRAQSISDTGKITHIVFMGMGEPLDNFENVCRAIQKLNDPRLFNIGVRRITISTSGVIPKMQDFAKKGMQVELSVSLHAANNVMRTKLMPINKKWPVELLIQSCREYTKATGRIVTFEYLLAEGFNASRIDAQELSKLLKNLKCKVNLIPLNPIKEFPYKRPTQQVIQQFQNVLQMARVHSTVRYSKGGDIDAACGQLRRIMVAKTS